MIRGLSWLLAAATAVAVHAQPADVAALSRACPIAAGAVTAASASLNVRDFGARGDGHTDDTEALRRALAALAPGQRLVFPAGTYPHGQRLPITTPGVTLDGRNATLHATNPADQALLIQASGVRVEGFNLTAVTDRRRDAPWESRIAVWRHGRGLPPVRDVEIRDNRIVESGAPGTDRANSSSSAAIFIHNATHFLVSGNLVRRSLADAIHVTGGSSHGRVIGNTVREVGDDMVAVVSYIDSDIGKDHAPTPQAWADQRRLNLVRDILIADNDLSGQYWGRGVSVVGGEDISIVANRIDGTSHAAGVYLARETSYHTFGVRNVRVHGNRITRVQSQRPSYTVLAWPRSERRTGHGAVEVVAQLNALQQRDPTLRRALGVHDVAIEANHIEDVATAAVRIGTDGFGEAAQVDRVMLRDNRLHRVAGGALRLRGTGTTALTLHCSANLQDGAALSLPACAAPPLSVRGATQGCERAVGS